MILAESRYVAPPEMRTQRGRRRSDHYKLPQLCKTCIVNKELGLRGELHGVQFAPPRVSVIGRARRFQSRQINDCTVPVSLSSE